MSQVFAALFGGIITVIFSGILLESYKRHRDLQGTASAVAGEIYSIIHMTEKRQTAAHFGVLLARLEAGEKVEFPDITGGDPPKIDPVIEKHLDRIGLLPHNLPERIATFYTYLRGIRIDLANLYKGQFSDPKIQAGVIRADLVLWAETIQLGNTLWVDLRTISAKVWWLQGSILQVKSFCANSAERTFIEFKEHIQKLTRHGAAVSPSTNTPSQASVVVTTPALAQTLSQSTASSFEPQYQELVSTVEAKINGEMPALTTRLGKNQEDTLRYLLIDQYCGLILERVSRFLYGSQIDALIFPNANNNRATRDEIKRFYDTATSSFAEIYKNY
jgi:hypothetical protein